MVEVVLLVVVVGVVLVVVVLVTGMGVVVVLMLVIWILLLSLVFVLRLYNRGVRYCFFSSFLRQVISCYFIVFYLVYISVFLFTFFSFLPPFIVFSLFNPAVDKINTRNVDRCLPARFACTRACVVRTRQARALANACSKSGHRISFFMRKGADCLSKWVGEAERQLRLLFEQARRHQVGLLFFSYGQQQCCDDHSFRNLWCKDRSGC